MRRGVWCNLDSPSVPRVLVPGSEIIVELDDACAIEYRLRTSELPEDRQTECRRTLAITAKMIGPKITFKSIVQAGNKRVEVTREPTN